jgi:hypothetical protein
MVSGRVGGLVRRPSDELNDAEERFVGLCVCQPNVGRTPPEDERLGISFVGFAEFEFVVRTMDRQDSILKNPVNPV